MTGSLARFDLGDRAGTQEPGTPGVKKDNGRRERLSRKGLRASRAISERLEGVSCQLAERGRGGLICEKRGGVPPEESYLIDCSSFIMATS
jgi:hypothetical protein